MHRKSWVIFFVCLLFLMGAVWSTTNDDIHDNSTTPISCNDLRNLQQFEEQIYSQNGEDGVLIRLLESLQHKHHYYVEFGVQDGSECITRILRERFNYTGLLMDGSHTNQSINLNREFIFINNTISLFQKYHVPQQFDVLSLDIDTYDFWVLAELLGGGYRPRIITVEVNPTLCVNRQKVTMREFSKLNNLPLTVGHPNMTNMNGPRYGFDGSRYYGANPKAFQLLGRKFGYEMLYCERCSVNCFLVLRSELPVHCQSEKYPLPVISYPCFASDGKVSYSSSRDQQTWHGLYGGHVVDPYQRSVVRVNDELLRQLVLGNLSIPLDEPPAATQSYHVYPPGSLTGNFSRNSSSDSLSSYLNMNDNNMYSLGVLHNTNGHNTTNNGTFRGDRAIGDGNGNATNNSTNSLVQSSSPSSSPSPSPPPPSSSPSSSNTLSQYRYVSVHACRNPFIPTAPLPR